MNWYKKYAQNSTYEEVWKELKDEYLIKGITKDPTSNEVQEAMLEKMFYQES